MSNRQARSVLQEESGKFSGSRTFLFVLAGLVVAAWMAVGIFQAVNAHGGEADQIPNVIDLYLPWLDWGHEIVFASVIPYAVNQMAKFGQKRPE